jgi:DNA-binding NtrC family response regulator
MQEKGIKILIADDEESIRTTLEFILLEQNFQVEAVIDGENALKKVNEEFFNIASCPTWMG